MSALCKFVVRSPLLLTVILGLAGCKRNEQAGPAARVVEAMNRGVSLMGQYQYEPAVQAFEEALKAQPGLQEARINLAIALFNRNRKEDLESSQKLLEEVLQKDPENVRTLYFKAIVLQHIGKAEEAIPCVERVAKQRPNDGAVWYLLGLCRMRVGQPAEQDFLRAVQQRPYLYSAYYQLYQSQIRAGNQEQASTYLDQFQALRQSPLGESVEFPQYNQMGELALARPLPALALSPISKSHFSLGPPRSIYAWPQAGMVPSSKAAVCLRGLAAADLNRDGLLDLIVPLPGSGRMVLLRQTAQHEFVDASAASGLESISNALSCAAGDFDNDDVPDLFVATSNGGHLCKGSGDGTFTDVTAAAGLSGPVVAGRSGLFLDADHDGDLDLFVCNGSPNQLWNNNGNGVFTNLAEGTPLASAESRSVLALPGDVDNDRDTDLVVLREGQPARVFLNQLLGSYKEADLAGLAIYGEAGGALQDFNGDGFLDLMVLGGEPRQLALYTGDGRGQFKSSEAFSQAARAASSRGELCGFRAADVDLDGDLDVVCLGPQTQVLLNDGQGRFVVQTLNLKSAATDTRDGGECFDISGDFVPDLLALELGPTNRLLLSSGALTPPSTALAVQPSGIRSRDERTRSPASGYGVNVLVRAGMREQRHYYSGQAGGANQSLLPLILGLGGGAKADYLSFGWPDGVAQTEMGLAAGQTHKIAELQRKVSSCPVLFAWNGTRFEFITDFAGVGGLGYFSAPGTYAPPQVEEHIKIEATQLRAREGSFELRVTEPMEESAYIDKLDLLAIDHPAETTVFPDERLAISGPGPTHELLVINQPVFAVKAFDHSGKDCTEKIARVDRTYAYDPPLDRRYVGFCKPHQLELDFAQALAGLAENKRVFLFINGFIEYPYSQTVYAASQSRVGWEPIRVERQDADGQWRTIVADGGAPGGMGRTMTIDLSGQLASTTRKLRLTTNLEVFYDQVFVARDAGQEKLLARALPMIEADLRRVGFAREYSPDGRLPLIYDYDLSDVSAPFRTLKGAYTRYGTVQALLTQFDDRYAIMGPGDEIALRFSAAQLPAVPGGYTRSFVLVSHAYCKDMDLYTGTPRTLEPLPFRGMSRYPYPSTEQYPADEERQAFLKKYNTRLQE